MYKNVELPLTYRGTPASERKGRVLAALQRVGMGHRAKHLPSQLSGGQQQRVAVARAVAGSPSILPADEPTGNLDSKHGEQVMELLRELHREGATICMVTHDPRYAQLDGAVYRKESVDQQDNNNFFDTGIIFPTTLRSISVIGAEARLSFLPRRGLSGSISTTTGRAMSSPPFTGGLFLGQDSVDLLSSGPFAIDHDQRLGIHGLATYDAPGPWWASLSVRHDSGLVSNPSNPADVLADPDFADLLPYVDLTAAVPRVRPRTIVDLGAGLDRRNALGVRSWSLQVQLTNLTSRTALYNFQSVFVGTRLVQPRTLSVRVARHF